MGPTCPVVKILRYWTPCSFSKPSGHPILWNGLKWFKESINSSISWTTSCPQFLKAICQPSPVPLAARPGMPRKSSWSSSRRTASPRLRGWWFWTPRAPPWWRTRGEARTRAMGWISGGSCFVRGLCCEMFDMRRMLASTLTVHGWFVLTPKFARADCSFICFQLDKSIKLFIQKFMSLRLQCAPAVLHKHKIHCTSMSYLQRFVALFMNMLNYSDVLCHYFKTCYVIINMCANFYSVFHW